MAALSDDARAESLNGIAFSLLLLFTANGVPLVAKRLLAARFGWPVDGGIELPDGQPLFGPSKTVRGLVLGIVATAVVAWLCGWPFVNGAVFGAAALTGDLGSSFVKRRLALPPSSRALVLDQVPESLLPLLLLRSELALQWSDVAIVVVLFFVIELAGSRVLYRLGVRDEPY